MAEGVPIIVRPVKKNQRRCFEKYDLSHKVYLHKIPEKAFHLYITEISPGWHALAVYPCLDAGGIVRRAEMV